MTYTEEKNINLLEISCHEVKEFLCRLYKVGNAAHKHWLGLYFVSYALSVNRYFLDKLQAICQEFFPLHFGPSFSTLSREK